MQKMSCEQIYNIWISEPNLIRIVDVRRPQAYEKRHIPGAVLASLQSLPQVIWENRQRLLVIFSDKDESQLPAYAFGSDCVIMVNSLEWFEKKWPSAGRVREDRPQAEIQDSVVKLETYRNPATGKDGWLLVDDKQREVCCVNAHEACAQRWSELQKKGYLLLFVLRTEGKAQAIDFQLAQTPGARLCVPQEYAKPETDIPLESGQEMLFGDRVIRIYSKGKDAGKGGLEIDFCGRYRVG